MKHHVADTLPAAAASPTTAGSSDRALAQLLLDVRGLPARELTEVVARRIETGDLAPGSRLPTIRELASASGASVTAVASAWSRLGERGLISTRRRGGTIVLGRTSTARQAAPLSGSAPPFSGWASVDLSSAHPSAEHLPDLRAAFEASLCEPRTHALQREHITDLLRDTVAARSPFAQEWTTVSGSGEATLMTCEAATPHGGLIAVQEPTTPGTVANLRSLGFSLIPVASDEHGLRGDSLASALDAGARTLLYQPRGTLTMRSRLTAERTAELAEVIGRHGPDAWVLEEDVAGGIPPEDPACGLSGALPDRVVRLTSYCRAFGIDLRTTVIGGARDIVDRVRQLRSHGIVAQSRILQNALAFMLRDPAALAAVAHAAGEHAANARALRKALAMHGVEAWSPPGGLLVWLPVRDEEQALAELAVSGVNLVPNTRTFVVPPPQRMLRVATPQLPQRSQLDNLSALLAAAGREGAVGA
jgi:DNA-binding transcriptional MocR family regulator